ncbi:1-deoxy-D-xylulose-5-phosphate synthase [Aneurinibacillus soli]|uniref:1-deoxy-D-xylulose-5-phosphate synthase n=1 Tax=Aneurinibacillus soli TaxID=1500254 RepID=A0A0U5AUL1_9BACL|nr:1-deoxy-D-xylulose-5-phosphate synthase [Aneurinibacillus soli]PYE63633.1 1-deoxy-D-xylulose-5-phosphate synthase [Aneurinibacillus soli]BAU27434.1 1-deoxy-D-xylulose-5-phosphate synthase [Aneurinibacillus soli]
MLATINSPQDVKKLALPQLSKLAGEIREFLIKNLSATGGHLAPNLGVVELTLALHYVYNSPEDKLIWDVGHQAYVHKMLTGRMGQFDTLRQYKGLCGYPKRNESEHDVWETGHSSTSLSAAMGMAIARDLKKEKSHVVAIIGDGALTGGMAFEAMNHMGHDGRNVTVILNDNEMSIAPNVGAMHNYLSKIRTNDGYKRAKEEVEYLLKRIPAVGGTMAKIAERLKDGLKYLLVSGILFEELGFTYLGPVDGHDFKALMEAMNQAKQTKGPVLIHVITKKGKGYAPAEDDSDTFHGVGMYKIESGETLKSEGPPSYTSVFGNTITKLAADDKRIVAITAAMPGGTGLKKFAQTFPDRFFDVGIAEQHATTLAAGIATQGLKPVFAVYSTFLQRGYDQLVHDVCRQNLNVVFAIDRAGLVGADGETHQGVFDIAYMRSIPNMTIMMPKDENELQHMLYTATCYDGPVAVRYPRGNGVGVPLDDVYKQLPIGKAEVLREGKGVAILAFGNMVPLAEKAADMLEAEGHKPMLVNARFAKPLDEELLLRLAKEGYHVVTVEEGAVQGGFGSAVLEWYAEHGCHDVVVELMGIPDFYVEHGSVNEQRQEVGLTAEDIAKKAHTLWPAGRKQA